MDEIDFRLPFFQYAQYSEISTGIKLFSHAVRENKIKDIKPVGTHALKAFWYTWKLSPQQYQQIFEVAKQKGFEQRSTEILQERESTLIFSAAGIEQQVI